MSIIFDALKKLERDEKKAAAPPPTPAPPEPSGEQQGDSALKGIGEHQPAHLRRQMLHMTPARLFMLITAVVVISVSLVGALVYVTISNKLFSTMQQPTQEAPAPAAVVEPPRAAPAPALVEAEKPAEPVKSAPLPQPEPVQSSVQPVAVASVPAPTPKPDAPVAPPRPSETVTVQTKSAPPLAGNQPPKPPTAAITQAKHPPQKREPSPAVKAAAAALAGKQESVEGEIVPPPLKINMIAKATSQKPYDSALINMKQVRVGDMIEGARVIRINISSVEIEYQGKTFLIEINR